MAKKQIKCNQCGTEIPSHRTNAIYCLSCSKERALARLREKYPQRNEMRREKRKLQKEKKKQDNFLSFKSIMKEMFFC